MTPPSSLPAAYRQLILVGALSFVVACGDSIAEIEVGSLQIEEIEETFTAIGQVTRATAEVRDPSGAPIVDLAISWTSSDPSVATVAAGAITSVGNGTAMIRASVSGVSDSVRVVVDQQPTELAIHYPYDSVFALDVRTRLSAGVLDANGVGISPGHLVRSWTVTDTSLASIDTSGVLTPRAPGSVTVTLGAGDLATDRTLEIAPVWDTEIDTSLAEQLQWAIEDALPATDTFGVSAVVILDDGSEWIGAAGWARPNVRLRPSAQTAPGSIAKAAAGAVLLTVIDEGLVSLEDTVGGLLPALTNVAAEVTVRQLLNNSSGIATYQAHPSFGQAIAADSSRVWTHAELMEAFIAPPDFEPGLRYKSTNTGFILGLMVAAAATGTDHRTLMRERVFDPLGLATEIHLPPWEPSPPEAVPGWWVDGAGTLVDFRPFLNSSLLSSRGIGLMTTSRAMAVFFRDFIDGALLSPALRDEALTSIPDDGLIPGQIGAGLGLREYNYLGSTQWGHSGAVSNGSGIVFHDSELGVTVAVMFNAHPAAHQNVHFTLAPELLRLVRDFGS